MFNKNDPLIGAVQEVMKKNHAEREAVKLVNEKFGIADRKALPHERQHEWDSAYKSVLTEGLHPNQEKLDLNKNNKLDKQDFKMLRSKKPMEEATDGDTTSPSSMGIKKPDYATGIPDYAKSKEQTVNRAAKTSLPAGTMKEEKATEAQKAKIKKVMDKWKKGKEHIGKSEKTVPVTKSGQKQAVAIALSKAGLSKKKMDEGFNNRHSLSVTASVEKQTVADQLNEAGGIYNPNLLSPKTAVVPKKKIPTPFPDRVTGQAPNRDPKSIAAKLKYQQALATGKAKKVQPTGELKDGGNFYYNKYKDKAETFARAATGDIGDAVGLTNPERGAALRKFNPGAAQAGDLAGVASMLLPGRGALGATTKVVSGASKVEKGASIIPKIAKGEGQGNRLAAVRRPGEGPWGSAKAAEKAVPPKVNAPSGTFMANLQRARQQTQAGRVGVDTTAATQAAGRTAKLKAVGQDARAGRVGVDTTQATRVADRTARANRSSQALGGFGKTVNAVKVVAGGPSGPSGTSTSQTPPAVAAGPAADKPKLAQTTTSAAKTPDYDKMSFKDAFKSARQQAGGAGGKFKYKGKEYQTNIQGKGTAAKPQEKYQAASKLKDVTPTPQAKTTTTTNVTGGQGIAGMSSTSTNKPVAKPILPTASMAGGGVNKPPVDAKAQGITVASSGLSKPSGATAQPYGMNIPAKLNPNSRLAQGNVPPKPQTMSASAAEGGLNPRSGQQGMTVTQRRDSNYNSGVRGK